MNVSSIILTCRCPERSAAAPPRPAVTSTPVKRQPGIGVLVLMFVLGMEICITSWVMAQLAVFLFFGIAFDMVLQR